LGLKGGIEHPAIAIDMGNRTGVASLGRQSQADGGRKRCILCTSGRSWSGHRSTLTRASLATSVCASNGTAVSIATRTSTQAIRCSIFMCSEALLYHKETPADERLKPSLLYHKETPADERLKPSFAD
jgi:hypothetical protein